MIRMKGFTLVELMVTMTILSIIGLLIAQITSAATRTVRISRQAVDAASQARTAFDRIALDFRSMLQRSEADCFFRDPLAASNSGYDADNLMLFLSSVTSSGPTTGGNRGLSMVAYRTGPHADSRNLPCLSRACLPIGWERPTAWGTGTFIGFQSNGLPVRLSTSSPGFPAELLPSADQFDILAQGVVQMVVSYQLTADNRAVTLKNGTVPANGKAQGQLVQSPPIREAGGSPGYIDLNRVSNLVIGVVCLDLASLETAEPAAVQALADSFTVPAEENVAPVEHWMTQTKNLTDLPATVPGALKQGIRLFERSFSVAIYRSNQP